MIVSGQRDTAVSGIGGDTPGSGVADIAVSAHSHFLSYLFLVTVIGLFVFTTLSGHGSRAVCLYNSFWSRQ